MTERIIRVAVNCQLELLYGLSDSFRCPLVPVITAVQIELIGFSVCRVALRELLLLLPRESQSQLLCNLPRNGLLDRKYVLHSVLILLAPKLCARHSIDQIHLDVEPVVYLTHSSHQYRSHI